MPNAPQSAIPPPPQAGSSPRSAADERRLRALVSAELARTARIIRSLGAPREEIEDIVQQAFVVTAARLADVVPGKERSFLIESAVRLAAGARRAHLRRRETAMGDQMPDVPDEGPTPEDLSDRGRALVLLDRVLDGMDEELRTVLVLFEVEEITMAEIATALGIPPGTVASRLRRARQDFLARVHRLGLKNDRAGGRP